MDIAINFPEEDGVPIIKIDEKIHTISIMGDFYCSLTTSAMKDVFDVLEHWTEGSASTINLMVYIQRCSTSGARRLLEAVIMLESWAVGSISRSASVSCHYLQNDLLSKSFAENLAENFIGSDIVFKILDLPIDIWRERIEGKL